MYNTPILLIIFNRLNTTQKVFTEIRKVKPAKLYIASDGPRDEKEADIVNDVRKYILDNIDWDCQVETNFRDENVGCKINVSQAITWFFDNVEEGIILEDDCLPHPDFFKFCEIMLEKYRHDQRITQVSGTCPLQQELNMKESYHFSYIGYIWGWATWRRAWNRYDIDMKYYPYLIKHEILKYVHPNILTNLRIKWTIEQVKKGNIDTWDYQWALTCIAENGLSVVPNYNLVSNIGFSTGGTNIKGVKSKRANLLLNPIPRKIVHPDYIIPYIDLYKKFLWNTEIDILINYLKRLLKF